MRAALILAVLSSAIYVNCADITSEYLSDVINSRLQNQKIELPEELLVELRREIENPRDSLQGDGITAIVNNYADKILKNIRKVIVVEGLDPMELPGTTLKLIPIGTITLSSGWLQDTSSISRNGNVTVTYSSATKIMTFNVPIKFNSLMFSYDYLTQVLLLKIDGKATGKVQNLKINVKLSFNYETSHAALDQFDLANTGQFSLDFSGNGLVDWIVNIMSSVVTTFLHPIIVLIIQGIVKGGLENAVDTVNSFIDSILHPTASSLLI